jgi:mono/diheme cytochrome c family protein
MRRFTKGKRFVILSAAVLGMAGLFFRSATVRAADAANPEGVKLFEAKIRTILSQNCISCHGEEKQKGGLRLDTRENMLKGGKEDEKVIQVFNPTDPGKSMIIEAIEYKNEDLQMPPPKKKMSLKLSDEQIKDMTDWIKMGAPYGDKPVVAAPK